MFKLPATNVIPSSWLRLSLIQQLFEKKDTKANSLLCIPGIDSFYDTAALNFMDFLFPYFRSPDNRAKSLDEDDDEVMEDVLFYLDEKGISLYCNPFTYGKLLNEAIGYNRSRFYCLDEEKYANADNAEEFKIRCLAHFTNNIHKILVPFTSGSGSEKVNPIEKWPLIQAYAIEDFGRHGFFTLKHDVFNFLDTLRLLSSKLMDCHTLNSLVLPKALPAYSLQWTNAVATICATADNSELLGKIDLAETFESYVKHGYAVSGLGNVDSSKFAMVLPADQCLPTSCSCLISTTKNSDERNTNKNYQSVFENHGAIVCFLKSPVPPGFAVGRTFFVETPKTGANQELKELESNFYRCLVEATEFAIGEYVAMSRQLSSPVEILQKTEKVFLKAFHSKIAEFADAKGPIEHIFAIEDFGKSDEIVDLDFPRAKFVLAAAFFQPTTDSKVGKIGVLFADTFLPIRISTCDSGLYSAQVFWLTNGISRYLNLRNLDIQRLLANSNYTRQEGSVVLFGSQLAITAYLPKHAALFPDAIIVTSYKVSMTTLDMSLDLTNGLSVNLDGSLDIISVGCFEQSSPPADFDGVFIEIHFSMRNRKNATFPFAFNQANDPDKTADGDVLVICLQAKTMPHREFYRLILPSWGVSKEGTIEVTEKAEKVVRLSTESKYINRFSSIIAGHLKNGSTAPAAALPRQFLAKNLTAVQISETQAIAARKYLPPKREFEFTFTGVSVSQNLASENCGKITVYVICGMPESGTDQLSKALLGKKTNDESVWLGTYSLLPTGEASFAINFRDFADNEGLQRFRQFTTEKLLQTPTTSASLFKGQVLIVCPFFFNLPCLFSKLEDDFREKLIVKDNAYEFNFKAAVLCLDGFSDISLTNRTVNPIVQDHLKPGILSAIIPYLPPGRNRDYVRGQNFDAVRRVIRALNPNVTVYRNANDIDLEQLPQFWSKEMCTLRCRFWTDFERVHSFHGDEFSPSSICFAKSSQAVTLVFKRRILRKDKLTSNLYLLAKQANGPSMHHYDEEQQSGEPSSASTAVLPSANWYVWHVAGEIGFADSDEIVRLTFTLPQQIFRLTPLHRNASVFFLTFYGENLDEKALRDWLRQSTPARPAQKTLLSVDELAPAFWGKLQAEHHLDPLPEGWYYNGTYYVDAGGEKAYRHPLLKEIAANYVAKYNADAEQANEEARSAQFPDLFE